jgi:hypothetical protein
MAPILSSLLDQMRGELRSASQEAERILVDLRDRGHLSESEIQNYRGKIQAAREEVEAELEDRVLGALGQTELDERSAFPGGDVGGNSEGSAWGIREAQRFSASS